MYISDLTGRDRQMSVVVDRGVGGSSIEDGTLEVMVHRSRTHFHPLSLA